MRAFLTRLLHLARRRRYLAIWSAGLLVIALVIAAAFSPFSPLDRLNHLVFDAYQKLKPREATESAVAVVDIDDESIRQFGQWPWSRTILAAVIDRLAAEGAAAIGLDMILSEADRTSPALAVAQLEKQGFQITHPGSDAELDHDRILAASFARAPVVAGLVLSEGTVTPPPPPRAGFAFAGDNPAAYLPSFPGAVRNLPILDEAAPGLGVFSFPPAQDGVVRQIPLVSRQGENLYPALSIESLRLAQGASSFVIRSTGASGEFDTGQPGMTALKVGALEIPTGPDGRIWVYYSSQPTSPVIPVHRLLGDPDPGLTSQIEGRIVLIGTSAVGLRDLVSTPLAAGFPGVLVHAAIIDQIVNEKFLTRPDWAVGLEVVAAIGLGVLVLAFLPWLSTFANVVVAAAALALSVGLGWLAFANYDLLLSPILPAQTSLLAYGVGSGVRLLLSESESRYIRSAFGHYLSPAMVEQLVHNPDALVLGGENRELTILFCDIRSFTSISETMEPTELTVFLNNFLTPMTNVLMESGATIDKYIGDAIMAFWNAPLDTPDHRQRACESVLAMLKALEEMNRTLEKPVRIGVGLNTGICCVGNLGSRQRFDYSAIGDSVNVGSRIEGLTKQYGLSNLVAESTASQVDGLAMLEIDKVMVVGRDEATSVYTLLGGRDHAQTAEFLELKQLHDRFLANYRSMRFAEAAQDLAGLRQVAPAQLQKAYWEYQGRLDDYLAMPPPAVQTFTIKPTLAPVRNEQQSGERCRDVAAAACNELLGTDFTGDQARGGQTGNTEYQACFTEQFSAAKTAGCANSPLYLYGNKGDSVAVTVGTAITNSNAPYSPVTGYRGYLNGTGGVVINNANYDSLDFDYELGSNYEIPKKGFVIARAELSSKLKAYAKELGMNLKETEDFVNHVLSETKSDKIFISHFSIEVSKKLLPLYFSPEPDSYTNVVFYINDSGVIGDNQPERPVIEKIERDGYTAVEISYIIIR